MSNNYRNQRNIGLNIPKTYVGDMVNCLNNVKDGNLINTSDEVKTTDEEEKAHSIMAVWNFEKQN